jgi:hypothetical protein
MSLIIEQKPKYRLIPAASEIVYTLYDATTINPQNNKFKIKYTAEVYVHNRIANLTDASNLVGIFKVTPNAEGYGMFDFSSILQNYVSADYLGGVVHNSNNNNFSSYNTVQFSDTTPHSIHQIDKFSTNRNSVRFYKIKFNIEAANAVDEEVTKQHATDTITDETLVYNGVLYDTDILNLDSNGNIGYNLDYQGFIMNGNTDKFLTNAPTKQYIRDNDYLTLAFFSQYNFDFVVNGNLSSFAIKKIKIQFYYNGATTGSLITKNIQSSTGGHSGYMNDSNNKLQFAGVGVGNLRGDSTTIPTNWDYYTVQAFGNVSPLSQEYEFYNQTEDCKNYETIRLTWLNKFGVWDYYNFTKKSVRMFNTQRKSYTQITGSWNTSRYRTDGHTGGKKYFANKTTESITLNTDYITESEAIWLEELFNSNDVYILQQRSTDNANEGYLRKYVKPTTITNSSHTRKTKANDRLIQYTFNIEVDKTKKSQLM